MKRNDVLGVKKHDDGSATGVGRKLRLHRETIRHLRAEELHIAGGVAEWPESFIRVCIPDI
jgi:hypothetical protein